LFSKYISFSKTFAIAAPVATALGVHFGYSFFALIPIASVMILVALVALDKIPVKDHPFYLFGITLALMYSASMVGAHVVGSDMHQEFYVSNQTGPFGWHPTEDYGTQSGTSFVIGWFVPFTSWLLHIPIIWVYKAILPLIFSFTPVVLYYTFKRQVSPKSAFLACIFFMAVPVATMEIVQIGKAMVAELFLALMILVLVSDLGNKKKVALVTSCLIIAFLAHYTVGLIALAYIVVMLGMRTISIVYHKWIFSNNKIGAIGLLTVLIITSGVSYAYYSKADNGIIVDVVKSVLPGYTSSKEYSIDSSTGEAYQGKLGYMDAQSPLVKTAVGLDFFDSTALGKFFRIIQYLTQLMIVVGSLYLLKNWKKYHFSQEFIAGIGASFFLILACIFVPHFSNIINVTRFYHLALFFLAPVFVIGSTVILRNWKNIAILIVIYFAFTSGLVFESIQSDTIDRIDIPYSIGLSAERTGVVSNYTESDIDCAKWLKENSRETRIVGDYNGYRLMMGYIPLNPQLRKPNEQYQPGFDKLPDYPCYVLLLSWNTEHQQYIEDVREIWEASGTRESIPLPKFDYPIVYQQGDSIVYAKY
jgi:uncharacterized membrane protein